VICAQALHTSIDDSKTMRNVPIVREFKKEKTPLANPFTANTKYESRSNSRSIPIDIRTEKKHHKNPFMLNSDSQSQPVKNYVKKSDNQEVQSQTIAVAAPLATEDACYACDACTQTVDSDKRDGCHLM